MGTGLGAREPVARLRAVSLVYRRHTALLDIDLSLPSGCMVGLIGPDGVGKSSLLSLIAGARAVQTGTVEVLGGDMRDAGHRQRGYTRIAYMPQGLGRNLYPTLSVFENIDFFGRLFGYDADERRARIARLTASTGLAAFVDRPAAQLSGGMKQKLGLCCALIHDPDLLVLDEPTTGVDPLSRRQFWELIDGIRQARPTISVLVATAYMEEAGRFDWLVAMDAGRILACGTAAELLQRTGSNDLEAAFIALLPAERRRAHRAVDIAPLPRETTDIAIEARGLTRRFGDFTAVDRVSFSIARGEIFGFIGSNGCGKTTTMKMLTGLLPPSAGQAWLFGRPIDAGDTAMRRRVGYMSQAFSLYSELTVRQNLMLHARLFDMPAAEQGARVAAMLERFELSGAGDAMPATLPLGHRQRLSLAVAMIHEPEILILDEPTSGVDPVARDTFWRILGELSRHDGVTLFVSTHFMNEAERCDRVALMHAGRVLAVDAPAALVRHQHADSLEAAFIGYIEGATGDVSASSAVAREPSPAPSWAGRARPAADVRRVFDGRRAISYARREALELARDPIRLTLALVGSAILMLVIGYGINMDVTHLSFAVLDRDQTTLSHDYIDNIAGSRYFTEKAPITDYADLDRRMRSGELSLALEIPPHFARDVARGRPVDIGAWIDGAMPSRAETVRGYVQGMHQQWLARRARLSGQGDPARGRFDIEIRYLYNPDVESLTAMVPGVIPMLLMLIPAMLAALGVVREKELGSIINFYVTPTTRLEFLLGKQLPYVVIAMINFMLLTLMAVTLFGVALKGSLAALTTGALLYVTSATALGLLISTFMRSQIAAIFGTAVLTLLPAVSFSGMINPVASLEGAARVIGALYPTTHFITISRGTFSKALGFADLYGAFWPLLVSVPVLLGITALRLRKQAR